MSQSERDQGNRARQLWARWDEVDRLLEAALDLPVDQREGYLRENCDETLLADIRDLLEVASREDSRPWQPGASLARAVWGEGPDGNSDSLENGRVLGRYRILREIGHGGMATVYDAERSDGQFEQRVALKLLRRGLDTEHVVRRFLAERQMLSGLEHAHIARLIDGGEAPDGRPYLVMELVRGEPIDSWADRTRLSVRERLRLFLQVADAVHFAHRQLIIHRDLKPSNILVDEHGHAKLLDFGIAKLLDPTESEAALTHTGIRPLTPAYASPEQVLGERVTTASDVYQLGLLLYVLLSGRHPFAGQGAALEAAITTGRILRPSAASDPAAAPSQRAHSARVEGGGLATAVELANARMTTPDALRRALRGDLDAIVLKAMRAEPERRYESAAELAQDVERFLASQPVLARPDSWPYRGKKFASRHPAVAAAGLAGLLFAATYVATLNRQAERLELERDRAEVESQTAEQVSAFLVDLFRANDPDANAGQTPTVLELLARGEERAGALTEQPLVQSEMLDLIAQMYVELGEFTRAEDLFRRALEMRRSLYAEPSSELAGTLDRLGDVLRRTGRYDEAEPLLYESIEIARLVGDSALESDAYTDLGHSLIGRGDYAGSEAAYENALAIRRAHYGATHERTAIALHNLALALEELERVEAAESLYLQSLDIARTVFDPGHSQIALTLTTLGRLYAVNGELDKAEPLLREAAENTRSRLGPTHPQLGLTLHELGTLEARRGEFAAAEPLLREALAIRETALGPTHQEVAGTLNNIAFVLMQMGRLEEAVPIRLRVIEIAREAIGESHENTGAFAYNLANLLYRLGEMERAEAYYRESLEILDRVLPEGHALTTRTLVELGELLTRAGRAGEAEPMLRRGLANRIALEEAPAAIAHVEGLLGQALAATGRRAEAEELLVRSHATLRQELGEDAEQTHQAEARLAGFHADGG
jgi:serine/threonine protein kinase/Flp pilus assembly protein TadD